MNDNLTHIAFFIGSIKSGGAERALLRLGKWISEKDIKVDILILQNDRPEPPMEFESLNFLSLGTTRVRWCIKSLINYLKSETPDVLLSAMTHLNIVTLIANGLTLENNTKVIIREGNILYPRLKNRSFWKRLITPFLIRLLYPTADGVVCVAEAVKNQLAELVKIDKKKLRAIYNPIITDDIRIKACKPPVVSMAADKASRIVSIGRLHPQKNYSTLLHAFSRVIKKSEAELFLIGKGKLETQLKLLAQRLQITNSVHFTGYLENPYSILARADLFVLPSKWEGLPNVIVEALFLECPVVATNCPGGNKEILKQGKFGRLVPVDDSKALSKGILKALDSPTKIPSKTELSSFKIDQAGSNYLNFINSIISE